MFEDLAKEVEEKVQMGFPVKKYHLLGYSQGRYFDDLAKTAKIKPVPPVLHKLSSYLLHMKPNINRSLNWRLIDDYNFEQIF